MGGRAPLAVRPARSAALSAALAMALAHSLGGCGYRELKAPCSPEEGAPPALSFAPFQASPTTGSPLAQMSTGSGAMGGIPIADPCGPLRRVNSSLATAAVGSPVDDPP